VSDRVRNARQVDAEREDAVRRYHCPVCAAVPLDACSVTYPDHSQRLPYAHTGRYRVAADAGDVPGWSS